MTRSKLYRIGNLLRGHLEFTCAGSLEEAWRKGSARFNARFPSRSRRGRIAHLEVFDPTGIPYTRAYIAPCNPGDKPGRPPVRGWVHVLSGATKQVRLIWPGKPVRARHLYELNTMPRRGGAWTEGFLACANFVNELRVTNNGFLAGDCALLKFNLLRSKRLARRPT